MTQDNTYKTSDTTLAAFLIVKQFALLYIEYQQPRFEFVFPLSEQIQEESTKFVSGNALTDPSTFARVNHKLLRIIRKQCQWEED